MAVSRAGQSPTRTKPILGMLPPMAATTVVFETDLGTFEIALDEERAPKSVANFLTYVDEKHYDGTIFHRVIPGFMAQGGGYDATYEKRPVHDPVENEADKTRKNTRGTVAMARTSEPHSATAQFFVNVADNGFLDHTAKIEQRLGLHRVRRGHLRHGRRRQDGRRRDRLEGTVREGRAAQADRRSSLRVASNVMRAARRSAHGPFPRPAPCPGCRVRRRAAGARRVCVVARWLARARAPARGCAACRSRKRAPRAERRAGAGARARARAAATSPRCDVMPRFAAVDAAVAAAIDAGKMPGCVLIVGRHDEVLLRKAYGSRALLPERVPMTLDTVFDLASLTKPVATSTSIMILVERGQDRSPCAGVAVRPRARASCPRSRSSSSSRTRAGCRRRRRSPTTRRRRVERSQRHDEEARREPRRQAEDAAGRAVPLLRRRVHRARGDRATPLPATISRRSRREEIFTPLGMTDTGLPAGRGAPRARRADRAARRRTGWRVTCTIRAPGRWAASRGHAGLFSTADDLARYARAMLGKGALDGKRIVSDEDVRHWTARRETSSGGRALGWDKDSRFATHRSALLSPRAFGHGGFTGTVMWIDPGQGSLCRVPLEPRASRRKGRREPARRRARDARRRRERDATGIDVLRAESFERLKGAHVGLVTNASARAKDGTSTHRRVARRAERDALGDLLARARRSRRREGKIADGTYHGVPVYSLYGDRFVADGLDARRHRHARLRSAGRRRALLHVRVDDAARDEGGRRQEAALRRARSTEPDRRRDVSGPVLEPGRGGLVREPPCAPRSPRHDDGRARAAVRGRRQARA